MIRNWKNSAWALALLLLLAFASCNRHDRHDHSAEEEMYTCPMHPTVTSDEPGACPVCGMDLVLKGAPGEELAMTPELSRVLKSPDEVVVASVNTIRPEYKSMSIDVAVDGIVTYDTRVVHSIPARVAGRLEKLYVNYEYQPVRAGQKVAEVYSPELNTAQREFVFLLENDPDNISLIDAARRKLELLGMTASQIDALVASRVVTSTVSIYSPYSGYVTMGGAPPTTSVPTTSGNMPEGSMIDGMPLVRAGDYVSAGQSLFTLVDSKTLRIELNVPGSTGHNIRPGSKAQLSIGGGKMQDVAIDFVEPFVSKGQPFTKLRVYAESREGLRIGSLVKAGIHIDMQETLWVPRESVLDLGTQQVVFVEQRGVLKPKAVHTGITTDGMIEIKSGLATSDAIAANAQFLVDSESFVKPID
jgi:multidrug efflux pump subunit AcrA (membrane-fusion protein)